MFQRAAPASVISPIIQFRGSRKEEKGNTPPEVFHSTFTMARWPEFGHMLHRYTAVAAREAGKCSHYSVQPYALS